jgi:glycosyltransferase involved in cell wall biosynthesis
LYCYDSYCFHFGGVSRKRKHQELGLKHDLDTEHNELYYQQKYNIKNKPVIGFYCFDAWEYWDENSINGSVQDGKPKGIGGSETQAIQICRELSKLGYKVKIFNKCKENHMDSGGYDVEYIPFQDFPKYSEKFEYDHFIASRYLDCFNYSFKSKQNIAMIHDVFLIMNGRDKKDVHLDKIDKYFCLSNRHAQFVSEYHGIPKDKIVVTSNGLDFSRFENKNIERNPYKLIYSSSPDRGLERLLDLFPRLNEKAELHIYYGFENFRDQEYVKKMMGKIDNLNANKTRIFYHGRVGQDQLAEEFISSSIWAYPTWFEETHCITALEAMAGGCVVLSSDYWGLSDTVKDGGILLPMNDDRNTVFSKVYEDTWVSECNHLLLDNKYREYWRKKGFERVRRFTWSNVAAQWDRYFKKGEWINIQ